MAARKMAQHSEIYHIFVEAFAQRAPNWVHKINGCNIITVCLIIESYDNVHHGGMLLREGTYIRAIPRDCANILFQRLAGTRYDTGDFMREFTGHKSEKCRSACSGILGRPKSWLYTQKEFGPHHIVHYDRELIMLSEPGKLCNWHLCGYFHPNGLILSGRAAEIFSDLWFGALALAGPMIVPTSITRVGLDYKLHYFCRGYQLATTFVNPTYVSTYYIGSASLVHGVYCPEAVTPKQKCRIFAQPLP